MRKIGIFYGSSMGTTRDVAYDIAHALGVEDSDVHDVADSFPSDVAPYDLLVLGLSTWGAGDMQESWYDFADGLQALDLKGKEIALFGLGDESMGDTFCNAVGDLYDRLKGTGATFVGEYPADCYDFVHTNAVRDGHALGLLLDNVNHADLMAGRVKGWTDQLKAYRPVRV